MTMLRDFGKLYEWDGGKLWFHPAQTPIKANLILEELETGNRARRDFEVYTLDGFIVIEAYLLDHEVSDPADLAFYLKCRSGSTPDRFEQFVHLLSFNSVQFLWSAFQSTRSTDALLPADTDEEKKSNSSSPKPESTPDSDKTHSASTSSKAVK